MNTRSKARIQIVVTRFGAIVGQVWSEHKSRRAARKSIDSAHRSGYTVEVIEIWS